MNELEAGDDVERVVRPGEMLDVPDTEFPRRDALPSDLNKRRGRIEARDVSAPVSCDAANRPRPTTHVEHPCGDISVPHSPRDQPQDLPLAAREGSQLAGLYA